MLVEQTPSLHFFFFSSRSIPPSIRTLRGLCPPQSWRCQSRSSSPPRNSHQISFMRAPDSPVPINSCSHNPPCMPRPLPHHVPRDNHSAPFYIYIYIYTRVISNFTLTSSIRPAMGDMSKRKSCRYEEEIEQNLRWCFALDKFIARLCFFFPALNFPSSSSVIFLLHASILRTGSSQYQDIALLDTKPFGKVSEIKKFFLR